MCTRVRCKNRKIIVPLQLETGGRSVVLHECSSLHCARCGASLRMTNNWTAWWRGMGAARILAIVWSLAPVTAPVRITHPWAPPVSLSHMMWSRNHFKLVCWRVDGQLTFVSDYVQYAKSKKRMALSTAAAIILLGSRNGWDCWKIEDGRAIGELKELHDKFS